MQKKVVLETIDNFEDEDGYDSELDSNASLKEDGYMSNIFILQEMDLQDDYPSERSIPIKKRASISKPKENKTTKEINF